MRYLADTHALLWYALEPERLSPTARQVMDDGTLPVLFSTASIWEMAIKISLKKLRLDASLSEFVRALFQNGFELLPIQISHTARVAELEWNHRDPFDRLLIAQALDEDLAIITGDKAFEDYPVGTVW